MGDRTDVVKEEPTHPAEQRAVNSGSSTAQEGPGILPEVRHRGIRMMEVSEHNDPVICPHVRHEIVFDESRNACVIGPNSKERSPGGKADVGDYNRNTIRFAEQWG